MTANDMRERAKDCYQRSERAKRAARLAKDSARNWLLRMSEQWADMGRQYEATAAQQGHWPLSGWNRAKGASTAVSRFSQEGHVHPQRMVTDTF